MCVRINGYCALFMSHVILPFVRSRRKGTELEGTIQNLLAQLDRAPLFLFVSKIVLYKLTATEM